MTVNIHPWERIARILIGGVLVSFAFVGPAHPAFALGLIPLATGVLGWCPPYSLLGINTCRLGRTSKQR